MLGLWVLLPLLTRLLVVLTLLALLPIVLVLLTLLARLLVVLVAGAWLGSHILGAAAVQSTHS